MADLDTRMKEQCIDGLNATWVSGESADRLWMWDIHTTTPTSETDGVVDGSEEIMAGLVNTTTSTEVARHLIVVMASGAVANLTQSLSMEDSCGKVRLAAECALLPYPDPTCSLPGPPPPPKGNEPEAFCSAINSIARTPFACVGSPLSQAMSFIAYQNLGQTANMWLTVSTQPGIEPGMLWWPVWLAAYAADAPSMLLFSANGGQVQGVLVVHSLQMEVHGPLNQIQAFWQYVDAQLLGDATVAAPSWSTLRFVMPSSLSYQVITTYDSSGPQTTAITGWKWGENLIMPNGTSVPWKFTKLVGIIDPCSANAALLERYVVTTGDTQNYCRVRGESWAFLGEALVNAGHTTTFDDEPSCPMGSVLMRSASTWDALAAAAPTPPSPAAAKRRAGSGL